MPSSCAAPAASATRVGREPDVVHPAGRRVVVLDRAAGRARLAEQAHGLGDAARVVGVEPLAVDVQRHGGHGRERRHVRDELVARDRLVHLPERPGEPGARRRERLEAERLEQPRRARIPRIRHQEEPVLRVELSEAGAAVCDGHVAILNERGPGTHSRPSFARRSSRESGSRRRPRRSPRSTSSAAPRTGAPPSLAFFSFVHAHLSEFSEVCASFQPSWTAKKLSGSVTASSYSWPTTMLHESKIPLPKLFDLALTAWRPQPWPRPGQSVFCHGMNAYWIRDGLPMPVDRGRLRVVPAVRRLPGGDRARRRHDDEDGVRVVVAEVGRCPDRRGGDRVVDQVLGQPVADDRVGDGLRIRPGPLYWVFGFVMYSAAGSPAQLVEPARMPRQYCVWTAWNELPPTPFMKEFR